MIEQRGLTTLLSHMILTYVFLNTAITGFK